MAASPRVPDAIGNLKWIFASNTEFGITAFSTGGQTNATQLGAQSSSVDTVAATSDSVKLPKIRVTPGILGPTGASVGAIMFVYNNGANSLQIYGAPSDTINSVATGTGITIPAGAMMIFVANKLTSPGLVGNWLASSPNSATGALTTPSITGSAATFPINGLAAAQGGSVTVTGGTSSTAGNNGGAVALVGGTPGSAGVGGNATLQGGPGGSASNNGGQAIVLGGAATAGNGVGGAATVTGGAGNGSGNGGAVTITSGAAGATGVAGVVTIQVGNATAGNGSALNLKGGAGAGGTNAGGNIDLSPGAAVSTGIPGEVTVNGTAGLFDATWQQYLPANVPVSGSSYTFFVANRAYRVKAASIICSSSATVPTCDVIKDTGTTAPGGGTSVLTGPMTFNTTANTRVTGVVSSTIATITLAAGDRLSAKFGGTVGSITGAMLNVTLVPA